MEACVKVVTVANGAHHALVADQLHDPPQRVNASPGPTELLRPSNKHYRAEASALITETYENGVATSPISRVFYLTYDTARSAGSRLLRN